MNLEEIRKDIDDIDRELTELFVKRMKLSAEVAAYKLENNMKVFDRSRESAVIEKVRALAGEGFEDQVERLYGSIFDISKDCQYEIIEKATSNIKKEG